MKEVGVEVAEAVEGVRVELVICGNHDGNPELALLLMKLPLRPSSLLGTNDLTQMTLISRDDAGTFLPDYVQKEILEGILLDSGSAGRLPG